MTTKILSFNEISDKRGQLVSLESGINVPFEIKRVYYIYDVPKAQRRGFHAHRKLEQLAICVKGSCTFLLDNGKKRSTELLDSPSKGLLIKGHIWREMYDFSEDCVLMILASELYDENDYIRDYQLFVESQK